MKDSLLHDILQSQQTVFTTQELFILWGKPDNLSLRKRLSYYQKSGYVIRLRRGLYAKTKEYNPLEVAVRLVSPSYISFETVLFQAGIIFQFYQYIYSASSQTKTIICDKKRYHYRQLRGIILHNSEGILFKSYYAIATPERAFLDMVYLHKSYYFDNLASLDWQKVMALLPLYNNKLMERRVQSYYKDYKES